MTSLVPLTLFVSAFSRQHCGEEPLRRQQARLQRSQALAAKRALSGKGEHPVCDVGDVAHTHDGRPAGRILQRSGPDIAIGLGDGMKSFRYFHWSLLRDKAGLDCSPPLEGLSAVSDDGHLRRVCRNVTTSLVRLCEVWSEVLAATLIMLRDAWFLRSCWLEFSSEQHLPGCGWLFWEAYWKLREERAAKQCKTCARGATRRHRVLCGLMASWQDTTATVQIIFEALAAAKHHDYGLARRLFDAVFQSHIWPHTQWRSIYQTPHFRWDGALQSGAEFWNASILDMDIPVSSDGLINLSSFRSRFPDSEISLLTCELQDAGATLVDEYRSWRSGLDCDPFLRGGVGRRGLLALSHSHYINSFATSRRDVLPVYTARLPTLSAIFRKLNRSEVGVLTNVRAGGASEIHRDPFRCFVFLCLAGCDGSFLQIGERRLPYRAGEVLAIDGTFDHSVWNEGASDRVALMLTFLPLPKAKASSPRSARGRPAPLLTQNVLEVRELRAARERQAILAYVTSGRSVLADALA